MTALIQGDPVTILDRFDKFFPNGVSLYKGSCGSGPAPAPVAGPHWWKTEVIHKLYLTSLHLFVLLTQ